ncbi:hypothetical protein PR001_g30173 [Phytophthora rubi]|nr:hypothetical protein PR001_g30173 [Phytophthora rubi]KAE8961124.1 hypothetical protein PR002_g30002 [Phytophthora rubi]
MAPPVKSRRTSVDKDDSSGGRGNAVTARTVASMRQALEEDEERQRQDAAVAALAQQSAAVQQLTFEQLKNFHDQQEEMAQRFSGYLQEQFENQLQLKGEYDALRTQMEQQKQQMAAHTSILREASEKIGHQAREIETLKDVVHHPSSPRGQVRWGWFAQPPPDEADDVKMKDTTEEVTAVCGEARSKKSETEVDWQVRDWDDSWIEG